jgi:hypothetical protein
MPKVKWGIDNAEPEELEGFDVYDGPNPPRGVYVGVITRLQVKENSNGDDMLNGLFIIKTTDPDKKKYNGCAIWFNQNITEQGKPYVLQFLQSVGLTWSDFVSRTVTDTAERPAKITKIGRVKFNDGEEVECRALVRPKRSTPGYPGGDPDIGSWLKPKDAEDSWDDDEDGDDSADEDDNPFK